MLPQLQVRARDPAPRIDAFFASVLPARVRALASARKLPGGLIGIVVGDEEWLVDLEHGFVRGGGAWRAVEEAPRLDVVLRLSPEELLSALRSAKPATLEVTVPGGPSHKDAADEVLAAFLEAIAL
jgi:hypothetical protein